MRWEASKPVDLIVAWVLVVLAAIVSLAFPRPVLEIPLGLLAVLVSPGYLLVAALFPERKVAHGTGGLSGLERAALSIGSSVAVVPFLGLVLDATPWGIHVVPILAALLVFSTAVALVAWWRRERLPPERRRAVRVHVGASSWREMRAGEKALTGALVAAILVSAAALVYVLAEPRPTERFTEFYVLGPAGKAQDYPGDLASGAEARVIVGIVNHEGVHVDYTTRLVLVAGILTVNETGAKVFNETGTQLLQANSTSLDDGATRETNVTFRAPDTSGTYKLEFFLDKPGADSPYRELHLWLNVTG